MNASPQPSIRSVDQLPAPNIPRSLEIAKAIAAIPGTVEFGDFIKYFTDYPPRSYALPQIRALLYVMVRVLRPAQVIEIGTLFAGTSEIFARALLANGQGKLTTIDPFGTAYVPDILSIWPAELRRYVDFRAINSAALFTEIIERHEHPDFIFIDGNHLYEFAVFDLFAAARHLRRTGVIVVDNMDIPGVRAATQHFEALNPAWQKVTFSPHSAFGERYNLLLLDSLYRVYVAPAGIPVGPQPFEFFSNNIEADSLRGLRLMLGRPSSSGRLHYQVYLQIIPNEFHLGRGDLEEVASLGTVDVPPGAGEIEISFAGPISTSRPRSEYIRKFNANLLFESDMPGEYLLLAQEPIPDIRG